MNLATLQSVRLKGGLADTAVLAGLLDREQLSVQAELDDLGASGLVLERRGRYRVTPEGHVALRRALEEERAELDAHALGVVWDEFSLCDQALKHLLHDWQLRDGVPNDHLDPSYDAAVVERLTVLHEQVAPLASRVGALAPRLERYRGRLDDALLRLRDGDTKFLCNPMCDSYHTVFHELHEELYDATGKDRAVEEAGAG